MRNQVFCLALILLLLCPSSFAQWVQTNGPGGSNILCFAVDSSGSGLFAGAYAHGVYHSTNNG